MRIETIESNFCARVLEIDLSTGLESALREPLRSAWTDHPVLVFPRQRMSEVQYARFARLFGSLQAFPTDHPDRPDETYRSANFDSAGRPLGPTSVPARLLKLNWLWHTDGSYRSNPLKGVVLQALECAASGGETIFADMVAAYEALPRSLRERIDRLVVRHSFEFLVRDQNLPPLRRDEISALPPVEHPLVRRLPDGRRSLFLSPPYMELIVGWSSRDSRALISQLTEWATLPRFTYTHHWQLEDIVVWDNERTMHRVAPYDLERSRRVMRGAILLPEVSAVGPQ